MMTKLYKLILVSLVIMIAFCSCANIGGSFKVGAFDFGKKSEQKELMDKLIDIYGDPTKDGDPAVHEVFVTTNIDSSYIPADVVTRYSNQTKAFKLWFFYDNFGKNEKINIELFYVADEKMSVYEIESKAAGDFGVGAFILETADERYPDGEYEIVVSGAGVSKAVNFEVYDGKTESHPLEDMLNGGNGSDGDPFANLFSGDDDKVSDNNQESKPIKPTSNHNATEYAWVLVDIIEYDNESETWEKQNAEAVYGTSSMPGTFEYDMGGGAAYFNWGQRVTHSTGSQCFANKQYNHFTLSGIPHYFYPDKEQNLQLKLGYYGYSYSGVQSYLTVAKYDKTIKNPLSQSNTVDKFLTSYTTATDKELKDVTYTEKLSCNQDYFNETYDFKGTMMAGKNDGDKNVLFVNYGGNEYCEGFVYEWKKGESTVTIPAPINIITPKNDPNRGAVTPYEDFAKNATSSHNSSEYAWVLTDIYLPEINNTSIDSGADDYSIGAGGGVGYETYTYYDDLRWYRAFEIEEIPRYFYPDKLTTIVMNTYEYGTKKAVGMYGSTPIFTKQINFRQYPKNGDLSGYSNTNDPFYCLENYNHMFTALPSPEEYWGYGTSGREAGDYVTYLAYGDVEANTAYLNTYEFKGSLFAGKPGDKIIMYGPDIACAGNSEIAEIYVYEWKKGSSTVKFNQAVEISNPLGGYDAFLDYIN